MCADPLHIVTMTRSPGKRACALFLPQKRRNERRGLPGLNLAGHVGDDPCVVEENRALLMRVLGASDVPVVVPNQVHGDDLAVIDDVSAQNRPAEIERVRAVCSEGIDGIVCLAPDIAPLLCFADCVPVIVVSPTGLSRSCTQAGEASSRPSPRKPSCV